jgi:hypothetical protein
MVEDEAEIERNRSGFCGGRIRLGEYGNGHLPLGVGLGGIDMGIAEGKFQTDFHDFLAVKTKDRVDDGSFTLARLFSAGYEKNICYPFDRGGRLRLETLSTTMPIFSVTVSKSSRFFQD